MQKSPAQVLIEKEWQKQIGHKLDKSRQDAINNHFFDLEKGNFTPTHYIKLARKSLQQVRNTQERMIYVLVKSRSFTYQEISQGLRSRHPNTVKTLFKKTRVFLQGK